MYTSVGVGQPENTKAGKMKTEYAKKFVLIETCENL